MAVAGRPWQAEGQGASVEGCAGQVVADRYWFSVGQGKIMDKAVLVQIALVIMTSRFNVGFDKVS